MSTVHFGLEMNHFKMQMISNATADQEAMMNVQNLNSNWKKTFMTIWSCLVDVLQKMSL